MASQNAISKGDSIVTSSQIDYDQKMFSHPDYKFQLVPPNNFGQPITLGTSRVPIVFNIPAEVFNWAPTELLFKVEIPSAGVGRYTWYALQALKEISQIQFYGQNGQFIVDIDNFQNYLDIVLKKELEREDFLTLDELTGVSQNNSLVNVIPALRNSNNTDANTPNLAAYPSSVNYTEPAYYKVTPTATALEYNVQFPMRLIKNTAFAIDKDMYYGNTTYLKLMFGPITKVCYSSDSNANPSAGTKLTFPFTGSIKNLQLMIAAENNASIASMIRNKVESSGMSYIIPYVQSYKNSNLGLKQNVNIPLDSGAGMTLMKVLHAVYNNIEDVDLAYDHANTSANEKILDYYTQLSSKRIQEINLDCTSAGPYFDYMQHKSQLKKSVLSNMDVYKYNWYHCDDFTGTEGEYTFDGNSCLISGVPLGNVSTTWTFTGASMRNSTFQHHTYVVLSRKLTIKGNSIDVSV